MRPRMEPERGVSLPVLAFNVVIAAGFWAITVAAVRSGGSGGVVGGVLIGFLALVVTLGVVFNLAMRRWPRGLHPPRTAERDGERCVQLRAWTPAALVTPLITVLTGIAGTLLGLGSLVGGVRPGVVMLPLGLWLLWLTALILLGRVPLREGAWLTPTRLVVVHEMAVAEVPWDSVRDADLYLNSTSVFTEAPPTGYRATLNGRRRPLDLPMVKVGNARLSVPPRGFVDLVQWYAAHPDARAELAGPDGLARVTRAAYTTQGGTADPAQHPARQPRNPRW